MRTFRFTQESKGRPAAEANKSNKTIKKRRVEREKGNTRTQSDVTN